MFSAKHLFIDKSKSTDFSELILFWKDKKVQYFLFQTL